MVKREEYNIIKTRMDELFRLALEDEKIGLFEDAHLKYDLIFKYSVKYKVRRPYEFKIWVCRKCRYPIVGSGGSIRLRRSTLIVRCGHCGYYRRFKINHSSMVSALNRTL